MAEVHRACGPSVLARRPEIVPIGATGVAWVALAAAGPMSVWVSAGAGGHPGHDSVFTPSGVAMIALMTVAMMALPAIPGVRAVAFASPWRRAGRAGLWFFAAYLTAWTVLAVCLAPLAEALAGVLGSPALAAGILVLACAAAQFDPRRIDLSRSCDRPMRLRGIGPDTNVDCARLGVSTAATSVRLCALPMLAMLAVPSSLLVMAVLTVLSVSDRATRGSRRLVIAVLYVILAGALWMSV